MISDVYLFLRVFLCVLSVCGKTKADIVFLVDESSSIGANNFIKMKDFIFRVTTYFPVIGPQGTQVSLSVETFLVLAQGLFGRSGRRITNSTDYNDYVNDACEGPNCTSGLSVQPSSVSRNTVCISWSFSNTGRKDKQGTMPHGL